MEQWGSARRKVFDILKNGGTIICGKQLRHKREKILPMSDDLSPILEGWDYHPGKVTVRRITGLDGKEKIQMRLYLGALQMEVTGRPDGQRPYGYESLLEYFQALRDQLEAEDGERLLELSPQDCADLREESMAYYYRYLALFHLEDYAGVVRDTDRNLRAFDLIKEHARTDADRYALEQYRPYVIMINSRARQELALQNNDLGSAYDALRNGMELIRDFFAEYGQPDLADTADEYRVLESEAARIRDRLPRDPIDALREKLDIAVRREHFEEAARLRDKIRKLEQSSR